MIRDGLPRGVGSHSDVYAEMASVAWERIAESYEAGAIETFEEACDKFEEWRSVHLKLGALGIAGYM